MYYKLEDKQTAYFDVDDTLILWEYESNPKIDHLLIPLKYKNETKYVLPHFRHIEKLKDHKLRGHKVIVWSQGGSDWCELIVKSLKLESYVDLIISKPSWFYDDLPASAFIDENRRIYIK